MLNAIWNLTLGIRMAANRDLRKLSSSCTTS